MISVGIGSFSLFMATLLFVIMWVANLNNKCVKLSDSNHTEWVMIAFLALAAYCFK